MNIRYAKREDAKIILDLIIELAAYEKLEHEVVADTETLEKWVFDKEKAHVLIGEKDGKAIGYCLYFYNFSTFHGKAGIYIEDIYVKKEYRGNGYGKQFFRKVANIAIEEGCPRIDWACLDWNKPSIEFYESLGAKAQNEWVGFRLTEANIKKLANKEV